MRAPGETKAILELPTPRLQLLTPNRSAFMRGSFLYIWRLRFPNRAIERRNNVRMRSQNGKKKKHDANTASCRRRDCARWARTYAEFKCRQLPWRQNGLKKKKKKLAEIYVCDVQRHILVDPGTNAPNEILADLFKTRLAYISEWPLFRWQKDGKLKTLGNP